MSATPEGWTYEAPDPEVGLFGGGWVHEGCDSEEEPAVEEVAVRKQGDTRTTTYRVTCSCGVSMQVESDDYDPDEMPEEAFRDEEAAVASDQKRSQRVIDLLLKLADAAESHGYNKRLRLERKADRIDARWSRVTNKFMEWAR